MRSMAEGPSVGPLAGYYCFRQAPRDGCVCHLLFDRIRSGHHLARFLDVDPSAITMLLQHVE
jgi:hypothetical protein